jgi:hypothetical protein
MRAPSEGAATVESGAPAREHPQAQARVRDIRLDGHPARRSGPGAAPQIAAVELSLDAPELDPDLRQALQYWSEKRGDRLAPARADIDPLEIAPLLPRVMLIDVAADPIDFRFRLAGTGIFRIHGAELTNKRVLDVEPAAYGRLLHKLYAEALARRAPVAHRLLIEVDTRRSAYARIILPLSEDGRCINRLMTVESYADAAEDLRDCLQEARLSAGIGL